MDKSIHDLIIQIIKKTLADLGFAAVYHEDIYLGLPTDSRFGDLSTNIALRLSKILKRPPLEIAKLIAAKLKERLEDEPFGPYLQDIKIEGSGFINFYLSLGFFYAALIDLSARGKEALRVNLGQGERVLLEFVSANPTGPLSVAHARQAVIGDALANVFNFLGFEAKKEYYLNDEGNQINILGSSIKLRLKELSGEKIDFPEDHYQGDYIYDIAKLIKEQGLEVKDFSEFGVEYILNIIKKELDDFGVRFDHWYSQKELRKSGKIDDALAFLKANNFLYQQDAALWFKSTQFGDDKDRVVIKSDGSYTYLAPDIAYHRDKISRGFDLLINLWGPDHHGYINRLKAALCALGGNDKMLAIVIVQLASIFREGKPVLMSTRRGQYITLREVLNEVGLDAARFFFLMRRTDSHLDFDLDVAKKQTSENPIFYIQYAHARICSILRNIQQAAKEGQPDFALLREDEEIRLIKKIWQFSYILSACLHNLDPFLLTVYLQELAEDFHKFYDKHRVLGQDENLTAARKGLIEAVKVTIAVCLELLGLSRPQEMQGKDARA